MSFLFDSAAWNLIAQSDTFSKMIVFSLFLSSIICIAIVALKFTYFRKELKQMKVLLAASRSAHSLDDFIELRNQFKNTLGGVILHNGIEELKNLTSTAEISEHTAQRFDVSLGQFVDDAVLDAERYLPVLGVSAVVSPLIGLFGTIWGLVHAFVNIGSAKSADLAVIAPGIAEALITTLAGLIVAIPAVIFFHYFSNQLRKSEQMLVHLADKFFAVITHTLFRNDLGTLGTSSRISYEKD